MKDPEYKIESVDVPNWMDSSETIGKDIGDLLASYESRSCKVKSIHIEAGESTVVSYYDFSDG
ncbi:MAG: hypothetical protein KAJ03_01675 [Gammaproteobacteria bacterium]|nr:hypothetical protein [Gammaproteobacteria bacterium]